MKLNSSISLLTGIGPAYEKRLQKLGISKIEDLLNHVPHKYLDFSHTVPINRAGLGETLTLKGEITFIKNQYTRSFRKIQIAEISDSTGSILAIWFNQPFLTKILYPGEKIALAGKIDWFGRKKAIISPEYEEIKNQASGIHTGRLIPIYPETAGITSKWFRSKIKDLYLKICPQLKEFFPKQVLAKYKLPPLQKAVLYLHFPKNLEEAETGKKRLGFNELFFLHLSSIEKKREWQKNTSLNNLSINNKLIDGLINKLPFSLTNSQKESVKQILSDLSKKVPMNRLLEGDVGSGKTVVAAIAAFASFTNGYQSVFMAPTQILAQQHFETLSNLFKPYKIRVALVTSSDKKTKPGRIDIFVGTHALIYNKVSLDKVSLVVIDEQHRFGVEQRASLIKIAGKRKLAPHVLIMTATPIPRTIALSLYGDLDLSVLNELPEGRQKISTWVVPLFKRNSAYKWIDRQIALGKTQVFVVCPLIEESHKETMLSVKSATKEFELLKSVFLKRKLGLLHGRQKSAEKNKILTDFKNGKIDILVSTPVVEVGIDIPNATIMVIEGAERFGLAQLHQLRGRVGRSKKKSYCLLFSDNKSERVVSRLKALEKNISGFELAELDLKLRGPGEIFGTKQHGFPELKIASWSDFELIKKTKILAEEIYSNPKNYQTLFEILKEKQLISN